MLCVGSRVGDKGTSREMSWKIIAVIQARDDGGLARVDSKKWSDSGHILKREPMRFTDGLEWDVRRREELWMMKDLA